MIEMLDSYTIRVSGDYYLDDNTLADWVDVLTRLIALGCIVARKTG